MGEGAILPGQGVPHVNGRKITKFGPGHPHLRVTTLPTDLIRTMHAEGKHVGEIAKACQRPKSTVYMWMWRNGIHEPFARPVRSIETALKIGKENPAPSDKWTLKRGQIHPWIIKALEELPKPWPPTREIAKVSGYADSTIRSWLTGKRHPNDDALDDFLQTLRVFAERSRA